MFALKLSQVGNSVGVILPKEALAKLGVQKGDVIYLTEAPGGDMRVSKFDTEIAEEVELGEAFMEKYKNAFRALAK